MNAIDSSHLLSDSSMIWLADAPALPEMGSIAQVLPWLLDHLALPVDRRALAALDAVEFARDPGLVLQWLQRLGCDAQVRQASPLELLPSDLPAVLTLATGDACIVTAVHGRPGQVRRCDVVVFAPDATPFAVTDVELAGECMGPVVLVRRADGRQIPVRTPRAAELAPARSVRAMPDMADLPMTQEPVTAALAAPAASRPAGPSRPTHPAQTAQTAHTAQPSAMGATAHTCAAPAAATRVLDNLPVLNDVVETPPVCTARLAEHSALGDALVTRRGQAAGAAAAAHTQTHTSSQAQAEIPAANLLQTPIMSVQLAGTLPAATVAAVAAEVAATVTAPAPGQAAPRSGKPLGAPQNTAKTVAHNELHTIARSAAPQPQLARRPSDAEPAPRLPGEARTATASADVDVVLNLEFLDRHSGASQLRLNLARRLRSARGWAQWTSQSIRARWQARAGIRPGEVLLRASQFAQGGAALGQWLRRRIARGAGPRERAGGALFAASADASIGTSTGASKGTSTATRALGWVGGDASGAAAGLFADALAGAFTGAAAAAATGRTEAMFTRPKPPRPAIPADRREPFLAQAGTVRHQEPPPSRPHGGADVLTALDLGLDSAFSPPAAAPPGARALARQDLTWPLASDGRTLELGDSVWALPPSLPSAMASGSPRSSQHPPSARPLATCAARASPGARSAASAASPPAWLDPSSDVWATFDTSPASHRTDLARAHPGALAWTWTRLASSCSRLTRWGHQALAGKRPGTTPGQSVAVGSSALHSRALTPPAPAEAPRTWAQAVLIAPQRWRHKLASVMPFLPVVVRARWPSPPPSHAVAPGGVVPHDAMAAVLPPTALPAAAPDLVPVPPTSRWRAALAWRPRWPARAPAWAPWLPALPVDDWLRAGKALPANAVDAVVETGVVAVCLAQGLPLAWGRAMAVDGLWGPLRHEWTRSRRARRGTGAPASRVNRQKWANQPVRTSAGAVALPGSAGSAMPAASSRLASTYAGLPATAAGAMPGLPVASDAVRSEADRSVAPRASGRARVYAVDFASALRRRSEHVLVGPPRPPAQHHPPGGPKGLPGHRLMAA